MKYSIVYSSKTGNTALLAEAIKQALPTENCEYFGQPNGEEPDSPVVFVGFWTDKGTYDEIAKAFLKTLKDKKVFLFGTAGFEGKEFHRKVLQGAEEALDSSNTVIGTFMCQGKMPIGVRQRYEKMLNGTETDSKYKTQIENFDRASTHPDPGDCENLKQQVLQLITELNQ